MLKLHPNFKSAVPDFINASSIDAYMGIIIRNQHMFHIHTTPHELKQWDKQKLKSFKIEYNQIERLYRISRQYSFSDKETQYELIVRVKLNDKTDIYVYLCAWYNEIYEYDRSECCIYGYLFISKEVKYFMGIVFNQIYQYLGAEDIYKLLTFDNIDIKTYNNNDILNKTRKKKLNLEYLCYDAIYKNRNKLQFELEFLPKTIFKNIDEFIKFREAYESFTIFETMFLFLQ